MIVKTVSRFRALERELIVKMSPVLLVKSRDLRL